MNINLKSAQDNKTTRMSGRIMIGKTISTSKMEHMRRTFERKMVKMAEVNGQKITFISFRLVGEKHLCYCLQGLYES